MWIGHRHKEPFLQAAHAAWSLGATIAPFIIGRFLVELPPGNSIRDEVNWTSTTSVLEVADAMHTAVDANHSIPAGILIL